MARFVQSIFQSLCTVGAVVLLAAPAAAQAFNPIGVWEPDNRESRYEFRVCGAQNDRLCAQLIWIQEDKKDDRNTKYLGQDMFSNARRTGENSWSGTVKLEGFNIGGKVVQTGPDTMTLNACALFVICEEIRLHRVQ